MKLKYKIGKIEFEVEPSKKKAVFDDGTKITWKDSKVKDKEDLFDNL